MKRAARDAKTSAHAFMVSAIERQTRVAEARREMFAQAAAAEANFERSGEYYALDDVEQYLDGMIAGRKVRRPKARTWPGSSSRRTR